MKTIPVYDPRGAVEAAPLAIAPRVKKLEGLRVGLLDNTKWNANKLLRGLRDRLSARHAFGSTNYYRKASFAAAADPAAAVTREVAADRAVQDGDGAAVDPSADGPPSEAAKLSLTMLFVRVTLPPLIPPP